MDTKKEIDIEKIMEEIRAGIVAEGHVDDVAPFNINLLESALAHYHASSSLNPHPTIRSNGGNIGRLLVFVKRVIRKCINFHITPIVLEINNSSHRNLEVMQCLRNFVKAQLESGERLDYIEFELNNDKNRSLLLEEKLSDLVKQQKMLEDTLLIYKNEQRELIQELARAEKDIALLRTVKKQLGVSGENRAIGT